MIRIFRKSWRRSKRTVCAVLCLVFLSSLLAVPAGAAETYAFTVRGSSYINSTYNRDWSSVMTTSQSLQSSQVFTTNSVESLNIGVSPWLYQFSVQQVLSGSIAVYVSAFYEADFQSSFVSASPSSFSSSLSLYPLNDVAEIVPLSSNVKFSSFPVSVTDGRTSSSGLLMKGRVNVDSIVDIATVRFSISSSSSQPLYSIGKPSGVPGSVFLMIPSAVLLVGDSSSLDSLEGIADGIAAQSEIMSAFYGDIMSLLNDLYQRLGDMQAVEELTNTYFAQLIPLVNSININTANIYSLLQTQFQLLRTLIATESDDIQAAIEKQTDDLIAYFDTVFSGATGDMPEKSDDLETSVGDFSDAESDYQSNATERFEELASTFSGFTGGTLAGVTLASTLFNRVWNALGQYNIVYYFPLLLGLSLVIIGRLPRGSGGQSSSEKHRGDSSA